jgi:hypothetical protein
MEREKEILKLVNVLRRTARMALQSEWTGENQEAAAYCSERYNRVLLRLKEIDQSVGTIFEPLPAGASLHVTAMACRQLAAYYEDELGPAAKFGRAYGVSFDADAFKEFWRRSGREIEDFGEFIRESIAEWSRRYRGCAPEGEKGKEAGKPKGGEAAPPVV